MRQRRGVSAQRGVDCRDPLAVALDGEFGSLQRSASRQFGAQIRVVDDCRDRPRDLIGVVGVDEESGLAGDLGQRRFARRDDRRTEDHRLEDRQAETLVERGKDDGPRTANQCRQCRKAHVIEPMDASPGALPHPLALVLLGEQPHFGVVLPTPGDHEHQRHIDAGGQIGIDQPADIFLGLQRTIKQQVFVQAETKMPFQLVGDRRRRPLDPFPRKIHRLIGVRDASLLDTEELDDVALGVFRNRDDVVRLPGDLFEQAKELPLILFGRERQPERDEIVDRIDVARRFDPQRQRISAVQDIRPRLEGEVDERLGARKIRPRIREKVAGDKNPVMGGERAPELAGDDGAAQFDRQGLDRQVIPRLVDGMVEGPSQGQLSLPRHAWSLLVEKRDLAQQRIFRGCEGGAVEDADLMAEIVGGTRQHARVCRDARPPRQRKVQAVEDDALGHSRAGATGITVVSGRSFSSAGAIACRGHLFFRHGPLFPRVTGGGQILRRSMIFVDSTRPIVKSCRHYRKDVYTDATIGVGMRQCDLASATASASRDGGPRRPAAPTGYGLLAAGIAARETGALAALLPEFAVGRRLPDLAAAGVSGVVGWSDFRHQGAARRRAAALRVPFLIFGHGLLRAPPGWGITTPMLSATAQVTTGPSSAADVLAPDRLLATSGWESPELLAHAAGLRRDILSRRLGGPWWNAGADPGLPRGGKYALIVVGDRKWGSANGLTSPALLRAMLAAAMAETAPHQTVVVAPDREGPRGVPAGLLRDAAARGCTVLTEAVDIWEALGRAGCVYTAGGETGFLALLAGAKIRCFGDSFYSGWGITTDEPGVRRKPLRRTVDEVFAGACLLATRYLNPYRQKATAFEDILEILGEWQKIEAVNRGVAVCLGMSFWKRRQVRDFLWSSAGTPAFRHTTNAALAVARRRAGSIAVWASRAPAGLAKAAEQQGIPLLRVEDGFVRSVGLGSDFMPAASLVLDSRGMHFDPSVRSDLDRLLAETEFDAALIERARGLVARLVARGITKYNLGHRVPAVRWPAD